MKKRVNTVRALSPWLLALYLVLGSWVGAGIVSVLLEKGGAHLRTLPLVISVFISLALHKIFHELGHFLSGKLSGFELIMFRRGERCMVREEGTYQTRELTVETLLTPVVMIPRRKKDSFSLYWLGGIIMNLLIMAVCLVILITEVVSCGSVMGIFLLSLILTGCWYISVSLLPAYHGSMPNDGLKFFLFMKDSRMKQSYLKDLKIVKALSEGTALSLKDVPDLLEDEDDKVMDPFRAAYLIRAYELSMMKGEEERASHILASLYYHLDDFSEEIAGKIITEAIYCLCLKGDAEENDLADRLVTPSRKKLMEQSEDPSCFVSLFMWSLHHHELKKESLRYYRKARKNLEEMPFAMCRDSWMKKLDLMADGAAV